MRLELASINSAVRQTPVPELIEANGQLVLAALRAGAAAETAVSELGELTQSSQRDALTGLPNRALMLDRLQSAMAGARRRQSRLAVLFIDVDRFKQVNDSLGHAAGDQALKLVAERLVAAVRASDTVSRHSGDEFVVLLADVVHPGDAALTVAKIISAVAEPCQVAAQTLQLTVSVGIAIYPDDGDTAPTLIARADAAMYRVKGHGQGRSAAWNDGADLGRWLAQP